MTFPAPFIIGGGGVLFPSGGKIYVLIALEEKGTWFFEERCQKLSAKTGRLA